MKRFLGVIAVTAFMVLSLGRVSFAGEIDLLLEKLVEKGVLTAGEAQMVKTETQEQVKKEIAQGKYSNLPQWLQTIKMKGDFRLRYQYDHAKNIGSNASKTDRQRGRVRLRLGVEGKVNEKLKVGVGLATGTTDVTSADAARSTNQTLGDSFAKKPIALDYAYAEYTPKPWATLIGGKFKNPLWEPGDLIWDTDINPEGGAGKFTYKLNPRLNLFLNTGVLIVDENMDGTGDDDDPMMYVAQPGIEYALTDTIGLKGAFSYYNVSNVKGRKLDGTAGTNSADKNGKLLNDFAMLTPALEITIREPLKPLSSFLPAFLNVPYFSIYGEYVTNPLKTNAIMGSTIFHQENKNTGYMLGFKFGAEKIEKWGDWQFGYNYAMLGKDAVPDILPDSDRYGGKTGIRAHEAKLDYGLGKNTWLGLDYYYGEQLKGSFASTQSKPASVVQVDWNMKF